LRDFGRLGCREIHLPKEGQVISKDAKSQDKFFHGIQLVIARNYIENLREELRRGCGRKRNRVLIPFITEPTAEVCKAGDLNVVCDCSCHYDLDKFSLLFWLQR